MKVSAPFNHLVPKDVRANLRWRAAVHRRIIEDPSFAEVIRDACAKDPLFFINGFCWTHDPRREPDTKLPFILYPYQEESILEILRAINSYDLLIEKSRDTGASWMNLVAIIWCWRFFKGLTFLLGSRVEDDVDKAGNPKSLFWKVDFLVDNLPSWLRPANYDKKLHRCKLHIENPENGSVVEGESTTIDFARGARCTAILLDEFASVPDGHRILKATRDATKCRLFNSTPKGTGNAFYDIRQKPIKKLRIHWSAHPLKAAGLYTTDENGKLKILDPAGYPEDYKPILDGKLRSPWYDNECTRAANAQEIAQELDINYLGSGCQFFKADAIQEAIRKYALPPFLVGDLEYDDATAEPIKFREDPSGHLRLWLLLDRDGNPSKSHKYSLGNDVSAGTGASNSCGQVWDQVTCEKVAEYVNAYVRPEQFAKQIVALARWLGGAFLVWESGGPGRQFGDRVKELGYGNVYLRRREEAISGDVSDIPGIAQTRDTKLAIMGEYRDAVEKGSAVNRSQESLEEALEYVYGPDGGVVHARASSKTDPSGAKSNHGDRAMADALAWKGIKEREIRPKEEAPEIPVGCLAWRNQMREQEKQPSNRELDKSWR